MFLTTTYSSLLRLYSPEHKAVFAQEMASTFEHAAQERRRQGWLSFARFAIVEMAASTLGIGMEWVKKQRAPDYLGRSYVGYEYRSNNRQQSAA
jgi:hypothetical protein